MTIRAAEPRDADAIVAIYNQGIADRVATFETRLRTREEIRDQIESLASRLAMLVAEDSTGVIGWAGYGEYRPRECYCGIGDYSVYVDRAARSKGCWKLVGRIFTFNEPSLRLADQLGFRRVGVYQRHAELDGEWLDVAIVERLIPENQP
ncbi:MAG: N-acetyltransferase family protein [Gemmatimonadetes bacterium]|nr:N-acetyltransferase family protein [Gemmatimonadota bacterium]